MRGLFDEKRRAKGFGEFYRGEEPKEKRKEGQKKLVGQSFLYVGGIRAGLKQSMADLYVGK